jgi:hypothetical protein
MPKQVKKTKRPTDINQLAHFMVNASTQEEIEPEPDLPTKSQISALMAHLGQKGGRIGGKRRLQTMTPTERKKIAKKAAQARWSKKRSH